MIEGAIFDLDGTLLDSMHVWDSLAVLYLESIGVKTRADAKAVYQTYGYMRAFDFMKNEYGVEYIQNGLGYEVIRRLPEGVNPEELNLYDVKWVQDVRGRNFLLFNSEWSVNYTLDKNPGLQLLDFDA